MEKERVEGERSRNAALPISLRSHSQNMPGSPPSALTPVQGIVAGLIIAHFIGLLYWVLALNRQSTAKKRD